MIPPEITDAIIDHLYSDSAALSNCSLVCRIWLPFARYHLFDAICLQSANIDAFMALRASPLCTIVPHVHTAMLVDLRDVDTPRELPIYVKISLALEGLSAVKVVDITSCQDLLQPDQQTDVVPCFPQLQTVRELSIDGTAFTSSYGVKHLISAFPALQ